MKTEIKIAWRYLFAKKSHNAINVVSGVSAAGVAVATAALVCVLSVLNGFNTVLEQMFSRFDPELRITALSGKSFFVDSEAMQQASQTAGIALFSPVVADRAMVSYKDHQTPAIVKGVGDDYRELTAIDSIITDGYYSVFDGAFERCVMGRGLAAQIGINAHFVGPVRLYAPERTAHVNLLRPDKALNKETAYIAGTFAAGQVEYDDQLMLVSVGCARRLFGYAENEATAVEVKVAEDADISRVKKELRRVLGGEYVVEDRYEQQADFFRIAKVEKLLCTLLLTFILLIAAFNCVGSLYMLILEKKNDMHILSALGATEGQIKRIFLFEGWLISAIGAAIGIVAGLAICLSQQWFGWLKLGNGYDYIISAYPVTVLWQDVVLVTLIVAAVGFVTAWIPAKGSTK